MCEIHSIECDGGIRSIQWEVGGTEVEGPCVVITNDEELIMIGGYDNETETASNGSFTFQLNLKERERMEDALELRLRVAGGAETPYATVRDVFKSTEILRDGNWIEGSCLQKERSGAKMVFNHLHNSLVTVGGYNGGTTFLSDMEIMGSDGQWRLDTRTMKFKRSGCGLAIGPKRAIYAVGGSYDGSNMLRNVERIDIRERTGWCEVNPLPEPRGFLSACFDRDGFLFAVGGVIDGTFRGSPTVFRYEPRMDSWEIAEDLQLEEGRYSHGIGFCFSKYNIIESFLLNANHITAPIYEDMRDDLFA